MDNRRGIQQCYHSYEKLIKCHRILQAPAADIQKDELQCTAGPGSRPKGSSPLNQSVNPGRCLDPEFPARSRRYIVEQLALVSQYVFWGGVVGVYFLGAPSRSLLLSSAGLYSVRG